MPSSRLVRSYLPMLAALVALLAFAPQAGANDEYAHDEPVCVATFVEDRCEPAKDGESDPPKDEVAPDKPDRPDRPDRPDKHSGACSDDDVARGATNVREEKAAPEEGCLPQFVRGFITRVWKFIGEVDYYDAGEMGMTVGKILNVPRKWRTQDDDLLDQDATVLVSNRARVFQDGKRVSRDQLDAANDVRAHGKLLRPAQWREDEDGNPVPTIRAKKVYITG